MEALDISITNANLLRLSGQDGYELLQLSSKERAEIRLALDVFKEIERQNRPLQETCKIIAKHLKHEHPELRGWSARSIYRKYRLWADGGRKEDANGQPYGPVYQARDWRCLVKNYNSGNDPLPPEFVSYLVSAWAKTTRENDSFRGIVMRLYRGWLDGEEIPGYGHAETWYRAQGLPMPTGTIIREQDMPRGWSYCNLQRTLKKALPRKSQRRAAQGQANRLSTDWAAQLLRDRSTLLPMQLWTIDDVRLDLQCRMYVDNKWQIVYVDALFALDVATGYILGFGIKGSATRGANTEQGREAGTKMGIEGRDVRALLLSVMERFGLPQWESKLLCENATAKLNKDDEASFLSLIGDRFKIDYTGMGRGQLLKSGFAEEWGRPGVKGWIESWFRKLHTSIQHLPGTTGRRYDMSRGDHANRVKYTTQLIKRAEKRIGGPLTPDHPLNHELDFGILEVSEVTKILNEVVDALNWRTDHRLQGFERVWEYKTPDGHWIREEDLIHLPKPERVGLESTPRMEAPAERLQRLVTQEGKPFSKFDPLVLAALYQDKRFVTLKGGQVQISDHRISTDPLIFKATQCLDKYEGEKDSLLAYIHDAHGHVVLADAKTGAHLCTAPRVGRVDITDTEAVNIRSGEVRREMEEELDIIRVHLKGDELALANMRQRNDELLNTDTDTIRSPLADEINRARIEEKQEKAKAKKLQKYMRDVDPSELLGEELHTAPQQPIFDASELLADD